VGLLSFCHTEELSLVFEILSSSFPKSSDISATTRRLGISTLDGTFRRRPTALLFSSAQLTLRGVGELRRLLRKGISRSTYTQPFRPIPLTSTNTCGRRTMTNGKRALGLLLTNFRSHAQEAMNHRSTNALELSFPLFDSMKKHGRPILIPL